MSTQPNSSTESPTVKPAPEDFLKKCTEQNCNCVFFTEEDLQYHLKSGIHGSIQYRLRNEDKIYLGRPRVGEQGWRSSRSPDYTWKFLNEDEELASKIRQAGGRLRLGEYVYTLSMEKFIGRKHIQI